MLNIKWQKYDILTYYKEVKCCLQTPMEQRCITKSVTKQKNLQRGRSRPFPTSTPITWSIPLFNIWKYFPIPQSKSKQFILSCTISNVVKKRKQTYKFYNEGSNDANHTSSRIPYFGSPSKSKKRGLEFRLHFRQFHLKKIKHTHMFLSIPFPLFAISKRKKKIDEQKEPI